MNPTINYIKRLKETGYDNWETLYRQDKLLYVSEAFQDKSKAKQLLERCETLFQEIFILDKNHKKKDCYRVLIPRNKIPACSYALNQDYLTPQILLPNELLLQIVSYLSIKDLGQLMPVNRKCYALANYPEIWKKIALSQEGLTSIQPKPHPKYQLYTRLHLDKLKNHLDIRWGGDFGIQIYFKKHENKHSLDNTNTLSIEFKEDRQQYLFKIKHTFYFNNDPLDDSLLKKEEILMDKEYVEDKIREMHFNSRKRKHSEL